MKKLVNILAVLLCAFLTMSCNSDDDGSNFEDIDVVTGINLVDFNGAPIGTWNQSNEKSGQVSIYPNPFSDQLSVRSEQDINKIWILTATCNSNNLTEDIPSLSQALSFSIENIEKASIKTFPLIQLDNNTLSLNLEDIDEGFYRVFYETSNGQIFWINTYNVKSYPGPENLISLLDDNCQ